MWWKKNWKRILLGAILCLVVYIAATTISICMYATKDEKRDADVAIVLGASVTSEGPSPVFRERINHAIWLYESDYVDAIIFTGGTGEGNITSEARIAQQYAIEQGIPEEDIYLEETSTITQENLANAKVVMEEHSFETAIIVSDPLHMKRAMLLAEDCGIEAYSSPTPTTMYKSLKTQIPFLLREEFFYVGYKVYRIFLKNSAIFL